MDCVRSRRPDGPVADDVGLNLQRRARRAV